ncbi:JAB domain-containing protein [uncultured Clostridium sp.]|uniref:JAB domain-containing protein n=1 Tax=uncultured Clostridium sp. TaxID=59620 RepID=UPI002636E1C2|nr:JAB domain-containing protein [uncultured Clostridium sp.]
MNVDIIEKPKKNIDENIKVSSPMDVLKLKDVQEIRNGIREHLLFIGLDNRNNVRNITLLGIGTSCNVVIDTKEIIRTALYSASNKVILVHNHPSNNLEPSKDDFYLTNVTNEMLKVFNIKLQDHIIVTEKDHISMDKIQKISKQREIKSISNMKKGLLLEENQRLKQQIYELQQKMQIESSLKVISAEYVGNYNDTTVYNVEIEIKGNREYVTVERSWIDREGKHKWEVFSNLALTDEEIDNIIQIVSKDPPKMLLDEPLKIYSQDLEDSVEETITNISDLDNENAFTVARVMENGKCVELHYNNGEAYLEYGIRITDDVWENEITRDVRWFNLNLTDNQVIEYLNKEFDNYYLSEKDKELEY